MSVEWREYAGKRFLHVVYGECRSEVEMLATYEQQASQMRTQPHKSLVLSDFTNASVGSAFMNRVREGGVNDGSALLEKNALVGITGLKGILLDGYVKVTNLGDKIRAFDTEAEVLEWLVAE